MSPQCAYFAYGSCMQLGELGRRGLTASAGTPVLLRGWRLTFSAQSDHHREMGFANLEPCERGEVHGVLFELETPIAELDRHELGYRRRVLEVLRPTGARAPAWVYIADEEGEVAEGLKPAEDYLARLLEGARQHALPAPYVDRLAETECLPGSYRKALGPESTNPG